MPQNYSVVHYLPVIRSVLAIWSKYGSVNIHLTFIRCGGHLELFCCFQRILWDANGADAMDLGFVQMIWKAE